MRGSTLHCVLRHSQRGETLHTHTHTQHTACQRASAATCQRFSTTPVSCVYVCVCHIAQEEDFNLLITGLPLDVSCPVGSASLPDESAVRVLSKALKDTEAASKTDAANGAIYQAITARLAYLKHVLQVRLCMWHITQRNMPCSLSLRVCVCVLYAWQLRMTATRSFRMQDSLAAPRCLVADVLHVCACVCVCVLRLSSISSARRVSP